MGAILVESGVMTEDQLEEVLAGQKRDSQRHFGSFVVEHGYASEEIVGRILAAQARLPFVTLRPDEIDPTAPEAISAHLATMHQLFPLVRPLQYNLPKPRMAHRIPRRTLTLKQVTDAYLLAPTRWLSHSG
jgi:hypothetical protein